MKCSVAEVLMSPYVDGCVTRSQLAKMNEHVRTCASCAARFASVQRTQSLVGSTLYHGFGFALYKVTGPTMCLMIGVTLVMLQGSFSAWWLRRHQQGPLEALWHRATWWGHRPANQAIVSAS